MRKMSKAAKAEAYDALHKFYKWTIEIQVSATWVEDGFDLDDVRAHRMLCEHLPHAYGHELKARVLKAPPADEIAVEQGYKPAEAPARKRKA